ncbi:hypothetical protein PG993_012440 [Apiospora rasikravindrae]|uniref:Uncharacterized protein n=1 Tax=Apiospora rasikravindrae TaxID=990691 RepID=A0ABR1S2H6_9PEZI
MANLPWTFALALVSTVAWFSGCIGVIAAADQTRTDSWGVSPTVLLAILGPLGSMFLQYALSCGTAITWWKSALDGTTLGTLHRQWDHGTGVWAAITSGRHADCIALAKVMTLFVFVVNPLLQRALTTKLATVHEDVKLSTTAATDVDSLSKMNFTDVYMGFWRDPVELSPKMSRIMEQFTDRQPITGAISGCTGNCSGTLIAAGVDPRCRRVRNTNYTADYLSGHVPTLVFNVSTTVLSTDWENNFSLIVFYAETKVIDPGDGSLDGEDHMKSCSGVSTTVHCVPQHAIVAYPFTQKDGTISPDTHPARTHVISTEPAYKPGAEPVFGGLSLAADSIFTSTAKLVPDGGAYGWDLQTTGPLTAANLKPGGDRWTCALEFEDPTEDIISKLNEIVLRIALAFPDASGPRTELDAQQETLTIMYESRYGYLWVALAITVLAAAAVARTAAGFRSLGRPVSLSPLEIVNAFGPPLLREIQQGTSNMTIDELMGVYRDTGVQYMTTEDDHVGGRRSGAEDMDTDASASGKRLQMCSPGHGTRPQPQDSFTG